MDDESAHLLMTSTDPNFEIQDCQTLLIWESIKFASAVTKKFDFEGSMFKPIVEYFRQFVGNQKPILELIEMAQLLFILLGAIHYKNRY